MKNLTDYIINESKDEGIENLYTLKNVSFINVFNAWSKRYNEKGTRQDILEGFIVDKTGEFPKGIKFDDIKNQKFDIKIYNFKELDFSHDETITCVDFYQGKNKLYQSRNWYKTSKEVFDLISDEINI